MDRRKLLTRIMGAVAALSVLGRAKAEFGPAALGTLEAPWEICPVCGVDQTDKAWYAGVQDAEGHSQAVCWGCRAKTVSPWPRPDTPFAATAKEAAERGKPVRSARVYQTDLSDNVSPTDTPFAATAKEATEKLTEEGLLKAVKSAFTHGGDLT